MPNLAALDFSTHYISDAECAAISLMTGKQSGCQMGCCTAGLVRMWLVGRAASMALGQHLVKNSYAVGLLRMAVPAPKGEVQVVFVLLRATPSPLYS
jgi:hypothetical protein